MSARSFSTEGGLRQIFGIEHEALYGSAATRQIEQHAASGLPDHTLMSRAGLAVARLARALHPHARRIWVACGPGNNGGDGLIAATFLHQWALERNGFPEVVVTHTSLSEARLPNDARQALHAARAAGVSFSDEPPTNHDLAIDALLGIGPQRALEGPLAQWLGMLRESTKPVLCVDLPSGLDADTGVLAALSTPVPTSPGPRHALSLLTLKPGLFTGAGRDAAGSIWFDDLNVTPAVDVPVTAWLAGPPPPRAHDPMPATRAASATCWFSAVKASQFRAQA